MGGLCSVSSKHIFHMQRGKVNMWAYPQHPHHDSEAATGKEGLDWPYPEVCLENQYKPIPLTHGQFQWANQRESNGFSSTVENEIILGKEVRSRTTVAIKLIIESSLMKKSMHRTRQKMDRCWVFKIDEVL